MSNQTAKAIGQLFGECLKMANNIEENKKKKAKLKKEGE